MTILPELPYAGQLEVIEVYEYYDQPVLFAARDRLNTYYLATFADETEITEVWLYAPMSHGRFDAVRSGIVDLYQAFKGTETGKVLRVEYSLDSSNAPVVSTVDAAEIIDDLLPVPGEEIRLPTQTLSPFSTDLPMLAHQSWREMLRFALTFPGYRTEAPAKELGVILQRFQETVDAIGAALNNIFSVTGSVPRSITESVEFSITGVGPGSFVVELASNTGANLLGESLAQSALHELINLLRSTEDKDSLASHLNRLQYRVSSRYAALLELLGEQASDTTVIWASPNQIQAQTVTVSPALAQAAREYIADIAEQRTERTFQILGRLIGANQRSADYELVSDDGVTYRGKIVDINAALEAGPTIGRYYRATLREITRIRFDQTRPTVEHLLDSIESANPFLVDRTEDTI